MDEGTPETEYQTRSFECVSFCGFTLCDDLIRAHVETMVPSTDLRLVPLDIARAMNPRPPSPNTVAATQRNQRRENSRQLSTRGEVTLTKMQSMPSFHGQRDKTSSPSRAGPIPSGLMTKAVFPLAPSATSKPPVRPPRDARRKGPQLEVRGIIPPLPILYPQMYSIRGSSLCCYAAMRTEPVRRTGPRQVGKWPSSGHAEHFQLQRTRPPPDRGVDQGHKRLMRPKEHVFAGS